MRQVDIDNAGPIGHVTIPLPEHGGIVVLRGANGAGKSTALRALDALTRPGTKLDATVRDGELTGQVVGLGRELRLTATRRTAKGDLEITALEDGLDLEQLVDPGIDDPAAADKRRVAVALRLVGGAVEPEAWHAAAPATKRAAHGVLPITDDPVTTAAKIREVANRLALNLESGQPGAVARLQELRQLAGDAQPEDDKPPVDRAEQELAQALQKKGAAEYAHRAELEARGRNAQRILDLQTKVGEDYKAKLEELTAREEQAKTVRDARTTEIEAARATMEQLREAIASKTREMEAATLEVTHCGRERTSLQNAATALGELVATLEDRPNTAAALNEAAAAAEKAREARDHSIALAARIDAARDAVALQRKLDLATREAADLRVEAQTVHRVLGTALCSASTGLSVEDGRLVVTREGRKVHFAALSDGERWRLAIELALRGLEGLQVLTIKQEAWQGLDGDARKAIAELARDRGVVIVTAEADTEEVGELRAEVVDA